MSHPQLTGYRASILHFPERTLEPDASFQYFEDGLLVTRNGKIKSVDHYQALISQYPELKIIDYGDKLLVPGFIDSHLHFPQTEMIASYGEQLLEWLENYTFPTENKFSDRHYATRIADIFIRQLQRHGTTSAMVYGTVHAQSCDALFERASQDGMSMIAGKVCMDRNCPDYLMDTPATAQKDTAALIDKWHGKHRQYYAITPRFAPTSSPEQMAALGELAQQYGDVFIQTHLSENTNEIAWVKSLYPGFTDYLDVYAHYNMVRPRAVFGHCLHLEDQEWHQLHEAGATIAFCPTSNLFLGSGLFDYHRALKEDVHVALATDVGGGTSFSMLKTLGEAYKICQMQRQSLSPLAGLYMMTQGSADALGLEHEIGNLNPGTDADFVLLDPRFDELMTLRYENGNGTPQDVLFALSILGSDDAVYATYVAGNPVYQKYMGE